MIETEDHKIMHEVENFFTCSHNTRTRRHPLNSMGRKDKRKSLFTQRNALPHEAIGFKGELWRMDP